MNKVFQKFFTFRMQSLTNKMVFFKRTDEKQQPKIRYRHVNPIYPPPGYDLKIPG